MAGFVGKFYIFSEALHQGYVGLVIIAVLNSVVSAYYYFYVLVAMYMQEGGLEVERLSSRPALVAAIGLAALATILIGVYPQPYIASAANAFHSASGAEGIHTAARSTRSPDIARLLAARGLFRCRLLCGFRRGLRRLWLGLADARGFALAVWLFAVPAYASASISIIMSGFASRRTSTTVDAGGESAKNSLCARATSAKRSMSVTNIRVRIT